MIGFSIIAIIVGYILLSKFIVSKVLQSYGLKKANTALAIMLLIPTWDVILGFPVYAYLCMFESGVKIYKSVDNVEGFYVGKWSKDGYGKVPPLPYEGYRYIDYQEVKNNKPTGKYFRTSWVDANTTQECIQIGNASSEYHLNLYKQGKCIVKEEIADSEVSRWEYDTNRNIHEVVVPILKIEKTVVAIRDRNQNQNIAENIRYNIDQNWVIGIMNESINTRGVLAYCSGGKNMLEK